MNANAQLSHFNCSESYYKYLLGYFLTDGVNAMADRFQCYWLLDVIVSYQPILHHETFQVWKLIKQKDDSAIVTCTDGNGIILKQQHISYTDIACTEATIWVESNFLLLPSEH